MSIEDSEIVRLSRGFFQDEVLPVLEKEFPGETSVAAAGFFGWGSECLGMDDDYSRDHHFGIRINMLLPDEIYQTRSDAIMEVLSEKLPESYEGVSLRVGHVKGAGVSPETLEGFLSRTIGITHPPESPADWLAIPEEDVLHVINGEVWHDPAGRFTKLRQVLEAYYPDVVWKRRIAHWCRYFSGMGLYAMKRAVLRDNEVFATTAFGRTVKWGMELAFLLNRTYYPYDKWLYAIFKNLPEVAPQMDPLLKEAVGGDCSWERRIELFWDVSDILDQRMVDMGLISPHPRFGKSPTSGYRLLEHAYVELLKQIPAEIRAIVPMGEQAYLESYHTNYAADIPIEDWDEILNLKSDP